MLRVFLYIAAFGFIGLSGCTSSIHEVITCTPPKAQIYWGSAPSELKKTVYETPFSREISESGWENWCYQVKKDGYHDSDIICREMEKYRYLDFHLTPLITNITSRPTGAVIYWGPSEDRLSRTNHKTPHTEYGTWSHAGWGDYYFQVRKEGYKDSKVIFVPRDSKDREIFLQLEPLVGKSASHSNVVVEWEDKSSDELGFEIERKDGDQGGFRLIATVEANTTRYTDTGLTPGGTYYYRVRAYKSQGHSSYSEVVHTQIPVQ